MSSNPNQGTWLPDDLGFHPTLALYGGESHHLEATGFDKEDAREIIDAVEVLGIPLNDKRYDGFVGYCVRERMKHNLPILTCIAAGFEFYLATSIFPNYTDESHAVPIDGSDSATRIIQGKRSDYKVSFRPVGDNYEYIELSGFQRLSGGERLPVTVIRLGHTVQNEEKYLTFYSQAGDLPGIGLRQCDDFPWDDFEATFYRVAVAEGTAQESQAA